MKPGKRLSEDTDEESVLQRGKSAQQGKLQCPPVLWQKALVLEEPKGCHPWSVEGSVRKERRTEPGRTVQWWAGALTKGRLPFERAVWSQGRDCT